MVELNYFIDELLRDVGAWTQVQWDHACHLILVNLDEVDACVGADNNLVPLACRLHLVDMTDGLEAFTYVQTKWTYRNYVNKAIVFTAHNLIFIDLSESPHTSLRPNILNTLEVLLNVEHLHLILPSATKYEFMGQIEALS